MTKLCEIGLRFDQTLGNVDQVLPELAKVDPAVVIDRCVKDAIGQFHTDKIIGLYHPFNGAWHLQCPAIYFDLDNCDPDGFCRVSTADNYVVSQTVIALGDIMQPLQKALVFEETSPGVWTAIKD